MATDDDVNFERSMGINRAERLAVPDGKRALAEHLRKHGIEVFDEEVEMRGGVLDLWFSSPESVIALALLDHRRARAMVKSVANGLQAYSVEAYSVEDRTLGDDG